MAWMIKQPLLSGIGYPWDNWLHALYQYTGVAEVFQCPSAEEVLAGWTYSWAHYEFVRILADGTISINTCLGGGYVAPVPKQGNELYRENKILIAEGDGGTKAAGWIWKLHDYGRPPMTHGGRANLLMVEGDVRCLPYGFGGFQDPTQSWYSINKPSTPFAY